MRRGATGGVLLILVLATCSWGYTFLDLGLGSEIFPGSGRCAGMGEVALLSEDTPFAVLQNPALLTRIERPRIAGNYRFYSVEEDWSFPAHDSFDALLGYTTYSRNSNLYHRGAIGVCSGVVPQGLGISFACAYAPVYDFTYDFYEEIRDRNTASVPTDKVIAQGFVESSGSISALAFGAGAAAAEGLSFGIGIDYLFGDFDITGRLSDVDTIKIQCWDEPMTETSDTFSSSNIDGIRVRVGGTYEVNKRLEMGVAVVTGCELTGDYTTSSTGGLLGFLPRVTDEGGELTVKYPASYALGVTFRPRNELMTVVEADVKYTTWSDGGNEALVDAGLEDIYEWHIGVEHVFYNQRPLRFGFIYKGCPTDDEISETAFTVGSGFETYGLGVEASVRVGWREYRQFDLFDDGLFCAESRDFADLVEETTFSGMITITRGL